MNEALKQYIEKNIFPEYKKNDEGHQLNHIQYVIKRSLKLAEQLTDPNLDIVYTIASYHDIGHHIDKNKHELLSAQIFFEDKAMLEFFTLEERILIKEAIEDHRASAHNSPRSVYGKIVSTADRSTDLTDILKRMHAYTQKHYPNFSQAEMIDRAYQHLKNKYGEDGYAKSYLYDEDYESFKIIVQKALNDKVHFQDLYLKANKK